MIQIFKKLKIKLNNSKNKNKNYRNFILYKDFKGKLPVFEGNLLVLNLHNYY
jgi:hypothetical protein